MVSEPALIDALTEILDVASPTGEEGPPARVIARRLRDWGLEGEEQIIDEHQS